MAKDEKSNKLGFLLYMRSVSKQLSIIKGQSKMVWIPISGRFYSELWSSCTHYRGSHNSWSSVASTICRILNFVGEKTEIHISGKSPNFLMLEVDSISFRKTETKSDTCDHYTRIVFWSH